MLIVGRTLEELNFKQLMEVYAEGNKENAAELYPDLPPNKGLQRAERDFREYLEKHFFAADGAIYVVWMEEEQYISALRLQPYQDGLLLEALETRPSCRRKGYACMLIEAMKREISQTVYSHVSKKNVSSLRTHEKCGFQRALEYAIYLDGSINSNTCTMCLKR